ncbi:MAG: 4-hydroxy-tetrahydrodipicolinate synthase [Clostridia bacterium]|nr:4-hydroxy-tetrahydrodipicolinate synthase [Clostridia bacterium]
MSHQPIFKGVGTAIITPMTKMGVDYENYKKLLEWQIESGVNAIIAAGTTGESSTLTDKEHREVLDFTIKTVDGRIPVIAGTGSNDTSYAIELSKFACSAGADGLLLVTPYYNKATQAGLIASYTAVADAVDKPMILYNVPSRTGTNILPETCQVLAEHPNIAAIKEASGNISQIADTAMMVGDKMDIYSGNDDQIVPIMALGGIGVISVLSNVFPKETVELCDRFFAGDIKGANALQLHYLPMIHALFSEVNPIPAKAAMAAMGFGENYLRLPLTPMDAAKEAHMLELMRKEGLKV